LSGRVNREGRDVGRMWRRFKPRDDGGYHVARICARGFIITLEPTILGPPPPTYYAITVLNCTDTSPRCECTGMR
jgi:hypothetical protein